MTWMEAYLAAGILLALLVPQIHRFLGQATGFAIAIYPFTGFILGLNQLKSLPFTSTNPWLPSLDLQLTLRLDHLGMLFWLMVTGIGTLIFIYASGYMRGSYTKDLGRLIMWLTLFMVAMLGVVSAGDLITLFIAWDLTSLTSFMLIGFNHTKAESRSSATQALMVTGSGGLILLAGIVFLGIENNTFLISQLTTASPVAIALIAVGCFTKSAQFPFHFWLPGAMAAPTPVSAFLHSATMVKAGVYLLARLSPTFGPQPIIATVGAITFAYASLLALGEKDLKRILAWSTVAALGSMTMLIGMGTKEAAEALVITILAHAAYKGCLFMVAGTIDLSTGTRDITKLGKLAKFVPALAIPAILAALSMSGIPLFLGFIKKEAQLLATLQNLPLLIAVIIGGISSVVVAYNVTVRPFFLGNPTETKDKPNLGLITGPIVLSLTGLIGFFFIKSIGENFLSYAASNSYGDTIKNHLKPWHGVNTEFLISLTAIALGSVTAIAWPKIFPFYQNLQTTIPITVQSTLKAAYKSLLNLGVSFGRLMRTTSVRQQMIGYFLAFVALVVWVAIIKPITLQIDLTPEIQASEAIVAIFAVLASFGVIIARNRLGGVAILGIVGVAITLTFVTFSAPDLALTQLLIEVLSVVLFVLVFAHLPRFNRTSSKTNKFRDAAVSIAFGATMSFLVLAVLSVPKPSIVSDYYAKNSYEKAKGKNVVNTILVDFRAADTMGEITVLCVAALGAHTLIRLRPLKKKTKEKLA